MKEKKLQKRRLTAQHSSPLPILRWSDKRRGNDFNLSQGQNRKKGKKMGTGKEKVCISSTLQQKHDRRWSRRPLLQPYYLERKKMTKWSTMFMRLLSNTTLNHITCHANSGQSKIDHIKFTVDPVQAPLVEQGIEIKIKVQSHHSTNNICPNSLEDISP